MVYRGSALPKKEENSENLSYSIVFGDNVKDMVKVAKEIRKRLKVRDKILEAG